MKGTEKIKIGMISFAHMHAHAYAGSLNRHPNAEIAWIYDEDKERAKAMAAQYKTAVQDSLENIASDDCHGYIICSENAYHLKYTKILAKTKKPILCEKPLATSVQAAEDMLNACKEMGAELFTAFPCRFHPAFVELKAMVSAGKLGEIVGIKGTNQGVCPWGWFVEKDLSGGGCVTDHTVHIMDLIRALTGQEAESVYARASNLMFGKNFEDTGIVNVTLENGVFATIDCSWSRPKTNPIWGNVKLEVTGTKGVAAIDLMNQKSEVISDADRKFTYEYWGDDMDYEMISAFVEHCGGGAKFPVSGLDGARTVEVVDAAYRSIETNSVAAVNRK